LTTKGARAPDWISTVKIVLASYNRGMLAELQAMFAPLGVELIR